MQLVNDLILFTEAWGRLLLVRRQLRRGDAKQIRNRLKSASAKHPARPVDPDRAWLLVHRAARLQWSQTLCLPRAIVLRDILTNRGLEAEIRLGIDREAAGSKMSAHAWVELGDQVIGEKELIEDRFVRLAST